MEDFGTWPIMDKVLGKENAQRDCNLAVFGWSVWYLFMFSLGTGSSLLKDLSFYKGLLGPVLLRDSCRWKILASGVLLRAWMARVQHCLCICKSPISFKGAEPVCCFTDTYYSVFDPWASYITLFLFLQNNTVI